MTNIFPSVPSLKNQKLVHKFPTVVFYTSQASSMQLSFTISPCVVVLSSLTSTAVRNGKGIYLGHEV
jgi:hypothetical protein